MGKQDRQGVRTAVDLERRYNFCWLSGTGGKSNGSLAEQVNKLNQNFAQFSTLCLGRFKTLEEKLAALSLDYRVTFTVEGEIYQSVSVRKGSAVSAPLENPTSERGSFVAWQYKEENVTFPYTPQEDTELIAVFQ